MKELPEPFVVPLRQEGRSRISFRSFCDLYIRNYAKLHKRSWEKDARRIQQYLLPAFGHLQLMSIKRQHVFALHCKLGAKRPYEANRMREQLSKMFEVAKDWGFFPEMAPNPAKRIKDFPEISRDRFVRHSEMPALAAAINAEDSPYVRTALWLYLLLGMRKRELLRTRWSDVDLQRGELTIPVTKSGRRHWLPLPGAAIDLLASLERVEGNPYVFPSHRSDRLGRPRQGIDSAWRRVRKAAGLDDVRVHDLRRTTGSWLVQSGKSLTLIGRVLNQSNQQVTAVYARLGDHGVSEALQDHAAALLPFINAQPIEAPAENKESTSPRRPIKRGVLKPAKNADIKIGIAEQILVEARLIMAMRERSCTKKDLYSKLGSQFKVNRLELQRILDEMIARGLVRRFHRMGSWRYELAQHG